MIRLAILLICLLPGVAAAHGVRLSVTTGGDAVSGVARFANGSPMAEAVVELQKANAADDSRAMARTRTDVDGRFAFSAPLESGNFRITVDDGIGHRGEAELALVPSPGSRNASRPEAPGPWRDWLSGIGYLAGLFGLASWWLARRKTSTHRD